MTTKARLHWFWRGMIAAVAGLTVCEACIWGLMISDYMNKIYDSVLKVLQPLIGYYGAFFVMTVAGCGIPIVAAALGTYGLLTQQHGGGDADGELHCRRCHHILRGLSEPRCPECGEAI